MNEIQALIDKLEAEKRIGQIDCILRELKKHLPKEDKSSDCNKSNLDIRSREDIQKSIKGHRMLDIGYYKITILNKDNVKAEIYLEEFELFHMIKILNIAFKELIQADGR